MLVTTTQTVDGYRVREYKGVARGVIVRAPTITQNISAKIKSVVGGKIGALTNMCESARQEAFDLMLKHAQSLDANAVLCIRYDTSDVAQEGTEVICYGTGVVIEKV